MPSLEQQFGPKKEAGENITERQKAWATNFYNYFKSKMKLFALGAGLALSSPVFGQNQADTIFVSDLNSKVLRAYKDSSKAYELGLENEANADSDFNKSPIREYNPPITSNQNKNGEWRSSDYGWENEVSRDERKNKTTGFEHLHHHNPQNDEELVVLPNGNIGIIDPKDFAYKNILPSDILHLQERLVSPGTGGRVESVDEFYPLYPQPKQPVAYRKENFKILVGNASDPNNPVKVLVFKNKEEYLAMQQKLQSEGHLFSTNKKNQSETEMESSYPGVKSSEFGEGNGYSVISYRDNTKIE